MNLFQFFQARSKWFYGLMLVLGMASSIANMGVLMLINKVLGGKSFIGDQYNVVVFIILITTSFIATRVFQHYMIGLTNRIMFDHELTLIQKIRHASYESFEKLGSEKIYTALGDSHVLSRTPQAIITLVNACIVIICSLFYLFWTAPWGGVLTCMLMFALLIVYLSKDKKIRKAQNALRDLQESYFSNLVELINGFMQFRVSTVRNDNLFNRFVVPNRKKARVLSVNISHQYIANELMGSYSWYIVLGVVIFVLPQVFTITTTQIAVFVATVLFMMSPVAQLIMFFPWYNSLKISAERLGKIDQLLKVDSLPVDRAEKFPNEFSSIQFQDLTYKYLKNEKDAFHVDITDLTINKGELVFITGGNGSGKTTFIDIFTGLRKPQSGKVWIDSQEVSWEDYRLFNNNMAIVFTTQYLFRENYDDHDLSENNERLNELIPMANLTGIFKLLPQKNWVDTNLSRGQQKRLALVLALLEDKQLVILDEWAAEQDPYNRRYFYTQWIQAMKEMGKTIIAISHDDDFYHMADRVIKFQSGTIVSDSKPVLQAL